MKYFSRAHSAPGTVLAFAESFFVARGFTAQPGQGDHARFTGLLGHVDLHVEMEGGHYTRVNIATAEVGESELDRCVKRCLSELHRVDEPAYAVRGAY